MKRQTVRTTTWVGGITLVAALSVLLTAAKVQASVTVTNPYHEVDVYDPGVTPNYNTQNTGSSTATISTSVGASSASSTVTATQSALTADFSHTRATSAGSDGESVGYDYFTVSATTPYTLSGTYTMLGSGYIYYEAELYDNTSGLYIFDNYQIGVYGPGSVTFTLGQTAGNKDNYLSGPLMGSLAPGDDYKLSYEAYIEAYPGAQAALATATGNVTLEFTSSSVPEPASLVVWSLLGALAIGVGRWRLRRAA